MQLSVFVACVLVAVVEGFAAPAQAAGTANNNVNGNGHVGKKGPYTDYSNDASCPMESNYEISQDYIIRTKDSKANGATFVAALKVRTFDVCLEQCCLKENCDSTIFQEGDTYATDKNCFLFECRPEVDGRPGPNLCLFTYHAGYVSSIQKGRGGFQDHVGPITTEAPAAPVKLVTTARTTPQLPFPDPLPRCMPGQFECASGLCINERYVCNVILDCDDGSDEQFCSPPNNPSPTQQKSLDHEPDAWTPYQNIFSSSVGENNDGVDDDYASVIDKDLNGRTDLVGKITSASSDQGSKVNGIAHNVQPPHTPPTPSVNLSPLHPDIVTQAPEPSDNSETQAEPALVVVAVPHTTAAAELMKSSDKPVPEAADHIETIAPLTDDVRVQSAGGSGMPPVSSAILPLVIGLVITVCLLLMVGCRLRYMNQRLRYGRLKTNAHDADYLINGMYL